MKSLRDLDFKDIRTIWNLGEVPSIIENVPYLFRTPEWVPQYGTQRIFKAEHENINQCNKFSAITIL